MGKIGIIADDLTGGTTVGVLLARSNIKTAVYFSEKEMRGAEDQEAIILTSDSRALPSDKAKNAVSQCFESLKNYGATEFSKRIDTTLRGGIGHEIDEMLENMPEDTVAVVVPAMPQSNRIVVGGYSVIDGTALSKTNASKDVLTPVTESHVPTILLKQTRYRVGEVDLGSVLAGKNILKRVLEGKKSEGSKIIICDAINMDEITLIAEAISELGWNVLAVDPGPFTQELAIAREKGEKKEEIRFNHDEHKLDVEGKVLVVAGSATDNTKEQMRQLNNDNQVEMISTDPNILADSNISATEIDRVSKLLHDKLNDLDKNVAIIETAVSRPVVNLKEKEMQLNLSVGEASRNINIGLSNIVKNSLENIGEINGIYLTGGDTMVTTLKSLGAIGIQLIDYVIPQTDLGKIIGGKYEGLITIGKGGLTGSLYTAIQSVNKISEEYKKNQGVDTNEINEKSSRWNNSNSTISSSFT